MMRKLPKQHLLGLALALVGVGAFLGIQISDVANQQTYAWTNNEDRLDQDFWDNDWTPGNDALIKNAVYGDGIGQSDKTRYSKYWTQHICDPNTMSIVYINSGVNNIPNTLLGNTIYVLESGPHIKTSTITMPDDCTAIIGQKTASYVTGAVIQFSGNFLTGLYIDDATNIVVGQMLFQPPTFGGNTIGTAIHTKNMDSSTIYVGEVRYYYNQGVLIEGGSNIYYNNYANYGNPYGTVITGVNDIMIGEYTGQQIFFISLNQTGLLIDNTQNVHLYGDTAYNYQAGAHIRNSSGVVFHGRYYSNNYGDGVIIENSTGITFNKWQLNNPGFNANGGYGLFMKNVSGVTGNGLFAIGNTTFEGYGLYMDNVTNLYLSNIVVSANIRNGVHATGSQNISLINPSSTGNGNNGIQTINTNNLLMSGGLMSGNQNHGVFLDQGSSGNTIKGITSRVNTLAGVYIANGASYNTLESSNIPQNGQNGVIILDSQYNVITGVTATGTVQSAGILLFGTAAAYNTVSHSLAAYANNGIGIMIFLGHDNIVEYSEAHSNNGAGFGIAGDNISWMVGADNNTIRYSTSHNNIGYAGFGLTMDISGNILHDIVAYENGDDGISISDTPYTNYIQNLRAYDNIDNGIQILQAQGTQVTTGEVFDNTNNGLSIEDSINSRIHYIKAYANDMHGVRLAANANYNHLSFIQTSDNGDNGIQITNSENNLFENIASFDNNGNDGVHIEFKSANNTFYDAQLYNNRIGFRQEAGENTRLLNALVYNNSMAGVALEGGLSSVNNAAIYNNATGLISKRAGNVINNVNIYNNDYGVSIILAAISSDLIFNNVAVYNNTFGIATSTTQGNTYNGLHMFDNGTNFVGTNGNDTQLQPSSYPWAPVINNNLTDTGSMTCNWAIQSTNSLSQNLLVYPYCDTRGQIAGWTPTSGVHYTFFPYIYKQAQPVGHDSVANIVTTGTFVAGMFVGDAIYTGYLDFGGYINLTSEGPTFSSGGFTYRYDNGPFDIEMHANTGTTKGFIVTGVNDVLWDGVAGSLGSFAGIQYPLVAQYVVPGNGLKIFRAGYDIAGPGLVSNYYGQIRGVAAPVCGDTIIEYTEQCDDGNTNDNDGCNATCQIEEWDCSWFSGRTSTGYAPHNITVSIVSGLSLTPYTFDVIVWGDGEPDGNINTGNTHTYMTGGSYTGSIQVGTQFSLVSATQKTCQFSITAIDTTYCGDGITQTPNGSGFTEECDLGLGLNGDGINGCTSTCTYAMPSCTLVSAPTVGYAPLNVNIVGVLTDAVFVSLSYGDGTTGASINTNHTYTGVGATYTPLMTVANPINGLMTAQCNGNIDTNPVVCGNGIIEGMSGYTTSGTIDYIISSSIAMLSGYETYDNTYLTGRISVYGGTLSTGTAVSYQWAFSGFSSGSANTGFIVGSSTGSTVSIFDDADGIDSDLEGTLTLEITDAEGNIVSTQSYLVLDYDTVASIGMDVGTITISGSQVTYSDYELYISSVQNGGTTIVTTSGSRTGLFGSQGWAGYDRYNDGIYEYTEQGTGQVVSYTYNITGGNITSDVTFFFSGFAMNMPTLRNPGGISQSYVLHTTPGAVVVGSQERCDDGNLIDGDGCSATCTQETPSCNRFTTTSQTGNAPHNFTISVLPSIYTGGYTFNQIQWMFGLNPSITGDVFTNNTYTYTGAGSYTARVRVSAPAGIQAQVGNTLNCSRPVTVTSSCGNFVVEGNEQCDDGNTTNNDGCSAQCIFEIPQTCGLSGNLVPNPGFESYTQCPTSYGQFSGYSASWFSSLGGDPDYGHANCVYGTSAMFGYVDQYPYLGSSGMVNILTYSSNIPNGGVEYVGATLIAPMQIGNYYDVGFCFATHSRSNYITDRLGMLFSTGISPTNVGFQPILQTPQFEHIGYAQGSGWTCVSGVVYADQAYTSFLLGSFHTNTGQNMIPNPLYTGNGLNYEVANYVIDDVFVSKKCATCGDGLQAQSEQCDLGTGNSTSCTPGYGQTCNYCSLSCTSGTLIGAYCGDGISHPNNGEQCDDGNQNNNDSCTNSCQRTQPSCTLYTYPASGVYPLPVIFSLSMPQGVALSFMNYGDGTTGTISTGHTYTSTGLFAPTAFVYNINNTGITAYCQSAVTSIACSNNNQCPSGLVCLANGTCGPQQCGNQKLEGNEQCDDGNTTNNDGCSAQCTFQIPQTCGLSGNLVPNPGFESYIQYSTNFSQFTGYAASWYSPSPDPDYMNLGSPFGSGILHAMGQRPRTGSGVAHILTYSSNITGAGREYIGAQLVAPMQIGKRYNVGFCYATHAISNYVSDKIGMLFSTGSYPTNTGFAAITQIPQFEHTGYIVGTGWTCLSGTILADKAYERFTIGSFHTNSGQSMIPNPMWNSGVAVPGYTIASYVIDDVFVSEECATSTAPYCGDGIKNGNEECDGGSGCRTNCTRSSGGGGAGPVKDQCDGKDESPSYYDGKCEGKPKHTAAPVGRACKYSDEQYLARGPFADTLTHRALPYTEMMRASCMWRGRDTDEGKWNANPNENITVAEVLKTFVKVQGVAFDDFDIKTENARYPKATPFADIPQDHWFAWYAEYALKKGLTQGLVTSKDGKQYLDPDKHITRNDAVKLMMITYDAINKKKVSIAGSSVLGDVVNANDPYYQHIRRAESLGFISGVKQKDGTYRFDGKRAITRAEFAKIVSVPFNEQLFDTSSLVLNSPVYNAIVRALDEVRGDKIDFMNTLLLNMAKIPDAQFIRTFKVTKVIFIQELRNAILPGLYEDASD